MRRLCPPSTRRDFFRKRHLSASALAPLYTVISAGPSTISYPTKSLLRSIDDGVTWLSEGFAASTIRKPAFFFSTRTVWAIIQQAGTNGWRSLDGGVTWNAITLPAGASAGSQICGAPFGGGVFAVDLGGEIYASTDGATGNWPKVYAGLTFGFLNPGSTVWTGARWIGQGAGFFVASPDLSGWSRVVTTQSPSQLSSLTGLKLAVAGVNSAGIYTTDGTANWALRSTAIQAPLRCAWSPELSIGVAVSTARAGAWTLDGITWTAMALPGSDATCNYNDVAWDGRNFIAVGGQVSAGVNIAAISPDGKTWAPLAIPPDLPGTQFITSGYPYKAP